MKGLRYSLWGVLGIVCFLWLGYEDRSLVSIVGVAVLICLVLGLEAFFRWTKRRPTGNYILFLRCMIFGALAGALTGPVAVLLALVKISMHHHALPDSTITNMRVLLGQSPTWMMAGLLFGVAGGFLKLSRKTSSDR